MASPAPPWYSATAVATTQAAPKQKNPLKPTEKPFPEKPEHPQDLYKKQQPEAPRRTGLLATPRCWDVTTPPHGQKPSPNFFLGNPQPTNFGTFHVRAPYMKGPEISGLGAPEKKVRRGLLSVWWRRGRKHTSLLPHARRTPTFAEAPLVDSRLADKSSIIQIGYPRSPD